MLISESIHNPDYRRGQTRPYRTGLDNMMILDIFIS